LTSLDKYGVGSCGPWGFYGTIDAHLQLESRMATFLQTNAAILYSDGASASTSTVAAFAKRGDLLIVDEGVHEALLTGVSLSRANVQYFRHNDVDDLRRVLEKASQQDAALKRRRTDRRRFLVVKGFIPRIN
jgi:serine palmitoyltransferase